jgi:NAD(P)-dependent dehydrogenase (short-subunit alcohol dehydrogenase family)
VIPGGALRTVPLWVRAAPIDPRRKKVAALPGKVMVVTGGTSGIGAETARLFAAEGAKVVIAGRRRDEGEALAAALGPDAWFVRADVRDEADVEALIAGTVDRYGRLDILVNNAGSGGAPGGIATLDLDRLDDTMAVHVHGVVAGGPLFHPP